MQPVPSPTSPDSSVSVRFSAAVLEIIRAAADAGLKSLPRRGAAIGGLLITSSPGDGPQSIEEAALVSSEYRYGPGYHLSPRDLVILRSTAASIRERKGRRVAGFFRSCTTDPSFIPSLNDLDVLRSELPDAGVFLIVKPLHDEDALARVFQLRNGAWDQTAEFPIHAVKQAPRPVRVRTVPKASAALTMEPPSAQAKNPRRIPSLWTYSLLGVLLLVSAIAFLGPRAPEPAGLGLNVNTEGDLLRVTWNRNSPAIRSGKAGVLRIDEGGQHQDITLNPGQLSSGSLLYRSNARDVTFHLVVNGSTHPNETIRFVSGGSPPAPVTATAPAPVSSTPAPSPAPRAITAEVRPANKPEKPVPEIRPANKPPVQPVREIKAKEIAARPAPATPDTSADRTAPQIITSPPPQIVQQAAKPPELVSSPPPPPTTTVQPVQPAAEKRWEPIKSVMHYFDDPAVMRPTPVKQVWPKTKREPGKPVQIRVLVAVDPRGGVQGAESLERPSSDPDLVAEAVAAARRWKFEPARDHGKKVAGTYTITFRFPPDKQ